MTRIEILKLLKTLRAAYPTAKIQDAEEMANAWELAFGGERAETIYKAARWHMKTNRFFPTIADINAGINRGELSYGSTPQTPKKAITAPKKAVSVACTGSEVCPYFEFELCYGTAAEMELCNL